MALCWNSSRKVDRTQLADLHKTHGQAGLRKALHDYFASPEGQAALAAAPRVFGTEDSHPMTQDEAVDALMEEAATMQEK